MLARRYGAALTQGLGVADVEGWPEALQAVTAEDIMAAARDVLDLRASVTLTVRPPDAAPDAPPNALEVQP